MGDRRGADRVLAGRPDERYNLEDLSIDGRTILKWIFKKLDAEIWTALVWFRIGIGGGAVVNAVMNLRVT